MLAKDDDTKFGRQVRELLQEFERARELNNYGNALKVLSLLLLDADMHDAARWFSDLVHAYDDLEHGRLDPILTPKKTDSRPPDSSQMWGARARVAAVARVVAATKGMTRRKAVEAIAHNFPELKDLTGPGADLAKSITSWRDEVAKGRVKNEFGRWIYEQTLDEFRAPNRPDPSRVGDLLSGAVYMIRQDAGGPSTAGC